MSRVSLVKRGRTAVAVAVSFIAVALAGCSGGAPAAAPLASGSWDSVVAAANKEGQLVVYSGINGSDQSFKAFQKAYPEIQLTVEIAPSGDLMTRLDQEDSAGASGADLAIVSEPAWYQQTKTDHRLQKIPLGPDAAARKVDDDGTVFPLFRTPFLLAYNTKSGHKIANIKQLVDEAGSSPVGVLLPSSLPTTEQYSHWDDFYGDDFLKKLSGLKTIVYRATTPMGQALASGEIAYAVNMSTGVLGPLQAQGAPVEQVVANEAVTGFQYTAATMASAKHPNAAAVFTNWMLSDAGGSMFVANHSPLALPYKFTGSLVWDDIHLADRNKWPKTRETAFNARWQQLFLH